MADHQATPEEKLRLLRYRLNVAPRDRQVEGGMALVSIADIRWLVSFIDAAMAKEDGQDAFDAFAARAAAGHLGSLVDDLRTSNATLAKAVEGYILALAVGGGDDQQSVMKAIRDADNVGRAALLTVKELRS